MNRFCLCPKLASLLTIMILLSPSCKKNPTEIIPPDPEPINRILFLSNSDSLQQSDLFTMNPDGSEIIRLTNDEYSYFFGASWSPDLSRIAVSGWPPLPPGQRLEWFEIYILENSGNFLYRLTWNGRNPVWSPDGKQLAFDRQGAIGNYEGIYIIDADGRNERKLNRDPYAIIHIQDWSKDGKRLLVIVERIKEGEPFPLSYELHEMDLNGNLIKQITDTKDVREFDARWSPDESKIAFSTIGLYRDVYVMNSDGSGVQKITPAGEKEIGHFCWSPDLSQIAFDWRKNTGRFETRKEWVNVFTIHVNGSGLAQITSDDFTNIRNLAMDWR